MPNTPVLIITSVVGSLMIILSLITYRFPPKKINLIYGYRTTRSMRNQQNWDLAQKLAAKYMLRSGITLLITGFALSYIAPKFSDTMQGVFSVAIVLTSVLLPFYFIEKQLK